MQFQVPQYYEVKEKIVGPLTIRQFLYLAAAGGLSFLLFFVLELWLWLVLSALFVGLTASLAFVEINGRPLTKIIWSAFFYYWRPRLYLWQRAGESSQIRILKKELSFQQKIKELAQKILTSRQPLKRQPVDHYQFLRHFTGKKEIARKVDYR